MLLIFNTKGQFLSDLFCQIELSFSYFIRSRASHSLVLCKPAHPPIRAHLNFPFVSKEKFSIQSNSICKMELL